jgi:Xaa-Pro aminopeptidase
MLENSHCRVRQQRLLGQLQKDHLDAALLAWPQHVFYFANFLTNWQQESALVLLADGRSWLCTANSPAANAAADQTDSYPAQWNSTQRSDQPAILTSKVATFLKTNRVDRVGIDASLVGSQLAMQDDLLAAPIDPALHQMRRAKDPDELALMKKAIDCTLAMYARAREIIEPGVDELYVFNQLHAAAVESAGEPLADHLGNDYQSNSAGGGARRGHAAQNDDLYILDLGPCYRGYFADNARTFAVNRKPTDAQHRAWEIVIKAHDIVRSLAKPGAKCRDIFSAVDAHYRASGVGGFPHHLGHGVGLRPHEFPHLNWNWDDTLIEGEIFTAEPGIYSPQLQAGLRIENEYLVTKSGIENLVPRSMELA